jgi:hypothetical protein
MGVECQRLVPNHRKRYVGARPDDHAIRHLGRHDKLAGSSDRSLGNLRRIQSWGTSRCDRVVSDHLPPHIHADHR